MGNVAAFFIYKKILVAKGFKMKIKLQAISVLHAAIPAMLKDVMAQKTVCN